MIEDRGVDLIWCRGVGLPTKWTSARVSHLLRAKAGTRVQPPIVIDVMTDWDPLTSSPFT
jgi:hypothetical protein